MVRVQPSALERDRSQGARIGNDQDSAAPSPASFGRPPLVDTDGWGDAPDLAEPFPPPAGSGRRRPSCRSISSQAAMVSRSCRCRCSTASSSCWARSSRGGCGGGLPPSPSPAFPRSTPAASLPGRETASGPALGGARSRPQPTAPRARSHPRDQPAPGPHSIAARTTRPPPLCSPPRPPRRAMIPLSRAPPRPHRSSSRMGVAVPLSCPARRRGRGSPAGS